MKNESPIGLDELAGYQAVSGVEDDSDRFTDPFSPDDISIDSKVIAMDTLLRRFKQNKIRLRPDFQRDFVWDNSRCSRLIESLMLKIPLPMFYVAADESGAWDVVDGLQRLTAIRNFLLPKRDGGTGAKLNNLEFWGDEFNGLTFAEIAKDSRYASIVNTVYETEMRFTIINPGTPEDVKRNVFKRINTGGVPLTAQEIRHALYQGPSTDFLTRLANSAAFTRTVPGVNDRRMAGRELILRFLAFSLRSTQCYSKDMDSFLSDTMRIMNAMPDLEENELKKIFKDREIDQLRYHSFEALEKRFKLSMRRARDLFGEHAFRKSTPDANRTPVNKALFETWGNLLAEMSKKDFNVLMEEKDTFFEEYQQKLKEKDFDRAIGRDSTVPRGVQERYSSLRKLINKVIW